MSRSYKERTHSEMPGPKIGDHFTIGPEPDGWVLRIWRGGTAVEEETYGSRGEAFRACADLTAGGMVGITLGVAR